MDKWVVDAASWGVSLTFVVGLLALGAFLALRWLLLWYWKVNEQVTLLREIRDLLRAEGAQPATTPAPALKVAQPAGTDDPVGALLRRRPPVPTGG